MLTPVEYVDSLGIWIKRDDLYRAPETEAFGGKARTCYAIANAAKAGGAEGLVTAGSRNSLQIKIVSQIGLSLGLKVRAHTPSGAPGRELDAAVTTFGAERVEHKPGYNSVIIKRSVEDAGKAGWYLIPFGMETAEAVRQTSGQVASLLTAKPKRLVVPVGGGMTLCGILSGLESFGLTEVGVLGVSVGADPEQRLDKFAPLWRMRPGLKLVKAEVPYSQPIQAVVNGITLNSTYEAKCLPFLERGDMLWLVG